MPCLTVRENAREDVYKRQSISGTVSAVKQATLANGVITQAVEIESDGEMRLYLIHI